MCHQIKRKHILVAAEVAEKKRLYRLKVLAKLTAAKKLEDKLKDMEAKKNAEIEAKKNAEIEAKKNAEIEAKRNAEIEIMKKAKTNTSLSLDEDINTESGKQNESSRACKNREPHIVCETPASTNRKLKRRTFVIECKRSTIGKLSPGKKRVDSDTFDVEIGKVPQGATAKYIAENSDQLKSSSNSDSQISFDPPVKHSSAHTSRISGTPQVKNSTRRSSLLFTPQLLQDCKRPSSINPLQLTPDQKAIIHKYKHILEASSNRRSKGRRSFIEPAKQGHNASSIQLRTPEASPEKVTLQSDSSKWNEDKSEFTFNLSISSNEMCKSPQDLPCLDNIKKVKSLAVDTENTLIYDEDEENPNNDSESLSLTPSNIREDEVETDIMDHHQSDMTDSDNDSEISISFNELVLTESDKDAPTTQEVSEVIAEQHSTQCSSVSPASPNDNSERPSKDENPVLVSRRECSEIGIGTQTTLEDGIPISNTLVSDIFKILDYVPYENMHKVQEILAKYDFQQKIICKSSSHVSKAAVKPLKVDENFVPPVNMKQNVNINVETEQNATSVEEVMHKIKTPQDDNPSSERENDRRNEIQTAEETTENSITKNSFTPKETETAACSGDLEHSTNAFLETEQIHSNMSSSTNEKPVNITASIEAQDEDTSDIQNKRSIDTETNLESTMPDIPDNDGGRSECTGEIETAECTENVEDAANAIMQIQQNYDTSSTSSNADEIQLNIPAPVEEHEDNEPLFSADINLESAKLHDEAEDMDNKVGEIEADITADVQNTSDMSELLEDSILTESAQNEYNVGNKVIPDVTDGQSATNFSKESELNTDKRNRTKDSDEDNSNQGINNTGLDERSGIHLTKSSIFSKLIFHEDISKLKYKVISGPTVTLRMRRFTDGATQSSVKWRIRLQKDGDSKKGIKRKRTL